MKAFLSPLMLTGLLLSTSGCQPSVAPASRIVASTDLRATPAHALLVTSPQQKISGQIPNLTVQRLLTSQQSGHLLIQAQLANASGSKQYLDYRVRWLNASGIQVDDYTAWQLLTLEAKQTAVLKVIAPSKHARDFVLELKRHD